MSFTHGILPSEIYLPARNVDKTKWAVIACDQYTSQRDYWDKVTKTVGDEPSALNLIQPEIDLNTADGRIGFIKSKMREYLDTGIIEKKITNGFILTVRTTPFGERPGLIAKVDLDAYEFAPGNKKPIRASEGTIIERLPPRMKIRRDAKIELPHIMLLVDDHNGRLVESAYDRVKGEKPLYDFELMLNGGRLRGYAIEDAETIKSIDEALDSLFDEGDGFLAAVGDGNHSLATAKACWEELKQSLSQEEKENHPARYALVEIVNLHCPALIFRPIHRVIFGADVKELKADFEKWLEGKGLYLANGNGIKFLGIGSFAIKGEEDVLPTVYLQPWLDEYLSMHSNTEVDYVHGEDALTEICKKSEAAGIELGTIDKFSLFPSIGKSGVLPRKSFSMGEADEKRFYMEARKII